MCLFCGPDPLPGPRQPKRMRERAQAARTHSGGNVPQIGKVFKRCEATTNKTDVYNRNMQRSDTGRKEINNNNDDDDDNDNTNTNTNTNNKWQGGPKEHELTKI